MKLTHYLIAILSAYALTWLGLHYGHWEPKRAVLFAAFAAANYMRIFW